jgi:hypothetical protein
MYNTALQVESNIHAQAFENSEEYAQKHGTLVILPLLRDRIALQVGQLLITIGQKLTADGTKNLKLSKDAA